MDAPSLLFSGMVNPSKLADDEWPPLMHNVAQYIGSLLTECLNKDRLILLDLLKTYDSLIHILRRLRSELQTG